MPGGCGITLAGGADAGETPHGEPVSGGKADDAVAVSGGR